MLNPIEEAKFTELKAMCRELHVPAPPEIFIGLQVHDKNGVLIFDDVQRGHSWTRNFYNFLYATRSDAPGDGGSSFGAGYMSSKASTATVYAATGKTAERPGTELLNSGYHNNGGNSNYGILVGTDGATAFSPEQYNLITKIEHGTGSGQLSYQAMASPTNTYTAATKTWKNTIKRIFNNNSGTLITVNEVGLLAAHYIFHSYGSVYHLSERSVLSPAVDVANGAQLTVTYEISMDFSAID